MVSKLKVNPFHNVNSPVEAPVTRRRPSGVHFEDQRTKHVEVKQYHTGIDRASVLVDGRVNELGRDTRNW